MRVMAVSPYILPARAMPKNTRFRVCRIIVFMCNFAVYDDGKDSLL